MTKFGKWLGGGLGWAFGGPIGAIIGFAIGTVLDDTKVVSEAAGVSEQNRISDFASSLLVLAAAVIKADGSVLKSEVEFVKQFFVKHFGVEHTKQQMLLFKEILNKDIPVADVCQQIKSNMELAYRIQLVYFLFGIALSDGRVQNNELDAIHYISQKLGISEADFNSIKSMYIKHTDSDYTILEIKKEASDDEVKKAYRKMAVKFHPDKVSHLGEEYQADAKVKFQKVQEAYDNIKKSRGIN